MGELSNTLDSSLLNPVDFLLQLHCKNNSTSTYNCDRMNTIGVFSSYNSTMSIFSQKCNDWTETFFKLFTFTTSHVGLLLKFHRQTNLFLGSKTFQCFKFSMQSVYLFSHTLTVLLKIDKIKLLLIIFPTIRKVQIKTLLKFCKKNPLMLEIHPIRYSQRCFFFSTVAFGTNAFFAWPLEFSAEQQTL